MMVRRLALVALTTLSLVACGDTWLGGKKAPPLPGKRISVLSRERQVEPEISGPVAEIVLPPPEANDDWPQAGGYSNHAMHHMVVGDSLKRAWKTGIGSGSGTRRKLLAQPIVAEGKVFTVDASSMVTAVDARTGDDLWETELTPPSEDEIYTSGGIAYEDGVLFIGTGFAQVVAVDAGNGKILWRQTVSGPMRGAPTVRGGRVFAVTVDNQTHALSAEDGSVLWTHSGISESASLLAGSSPAVDGNIVVVPYSSGELFALRVENGSVVWQDALSAIRRTQTVGAMTDIRGRPVIDRGRVYAIGNADQLACIDLRTGRRLWEKEIGGLQSPWIAGDYLYVVTNNSEVVALEAKTGRIVWVTQMQSWEDEAEHKGRIMWAGPVLVSDRLVVSSSTGKLVALSPYTGTVLGVDEAPDGVTISPAVAGGSLYFVTDDADLVAYR
jgi:outer membrane protein assembly factor BamB